MQWNIQNENEVYKDFCLKGKTKVLWSKMLLKSEVGNMDATGKYNTVISPK